MICTDLQTQSSSFQALFSDVKKEEKQEAELEIIIEGLLVKRGVDRRRKRETEERRTETTSKVCPSVRDTCVLEKFSCLLTEESCHSDKPAWLKVIHELILDRQEGSFSCCFQPLKLGAA